MTYTSNLESEIDSASDHSEIISRAFDHAEAEIVDPANVAGDPCFEPRPKLAEQFGLAAVMDREGIGDGVIASVNAGDENWEDSRR